MDNYILKQFGTLEASSNYEYGTIQEVQPNNTYVVETTNGLQVVVQERTVYSMSDVIVLGLPMGSINNAFILKKAGSSVKPLPENFIVINGLN